MLLEELLNQLNERASTENPPSYKIIVSFKEEDKENGKFYAMYDPAQYSDHADLENAARKQGKKGSFCRFTTKGRKIVAGLRQYEDIKDDIMSDFILQMTGKSPAHHVFFPMTN